MVATVVNLTSASSTVHYFRLDGYGRGRGAPTDDVGDYYARKDDEHRKASHWRGSGAALLGLRGHVEPGEFRRVLEGYVPGTEVQLGRVRDGVFEHRAGVDMTLSAPKSVSLEALLGGPGSAAPFAPTTRPSAGPSTSSNGACSRPGGGTRRSGVRCRSGRPFSWRRPSSM